MAKKNPQKVVPFLSPENYIRQKSKTLPIYKCFINKEWEEAREANIVITRKHVTGNVTVCVYLVDLYCLGIKDSFFNFNIPYEEFEERFKMDRNRGAFLIETSYELVHNIIYAGIEFAEKYGFQPCKEFTSVTEFFLEEDTDDIPLMEIACGNEKDGKPLYFNVGNESPDRVRQILGQLERVAGKGNYHYHTQISKPDDYDDDDYEEDNDNDDEVYEDEDYDAEYEEKYKKIAAIKAEIISLDIEERKKIFINLTEKDVKEPYSVEESVRLFAASNSLCYELTDVNEINEQFKILEKKFKHTRGEEVFPNSVFPHKEKGTDVLIIDLFYDAFMGIADYDKDAEEDIETFKVEAGDCAAADFLDVYYLLTKQSEKYTAASEEIYQKHPGYFLIQAIYFANLGDKTKQSIKEELENLLLETKHSLLDFELEFYFYVYAFNLVQDKNKSLATVLAYEKYINTLDILMDDKKGIIQNLIQVAKTDKLEAYLKKNTTE
ncbi:MAG: hypothetical protein LBE82_08430 [Chitinophagaceae bacterium]|jgi:hypothetical protein|nr:hypothetical protein [Chitinophagaceae bacterium]